MKSYILLFNITLKKRLKRFAFQRHEYKNIYTIFLQLPNIWEESPSIDDFIESVNYFTTQELFCFLSHRILDCTFSKYMFCSKNRCFFGSLMKELLDEHFFS